MTSSTQRSLFLLTLLATLISAGCGSGSTSGSRGFGQQNFTLSASPTNPSIGQGGTGSTTITVVPQNGFNGTVALTASNLPSGVSASFNPSSTTTTSVMTITVAGTASTGNTAVTVTGTSGTLSPSTPVSLTVAAPSVNVTLSPKLAAIAAATQTQQYTTTVTGNMGNSNVNWSVDGVAGGNPTLGTISSSGLYTAPPTGGAHTITATSAALPSSSASANIGITDLAGVFTYHNDLARDGANLQEYALNSSTVKTASFGKLFTCSVDGAVYAQPLWVPGLSIGGGIHNLIFVATQHDSLYAFDADATPCVKYWRANLIDTLHGGASTENPVVWDEVGNCLGDIYPEVGVTGTPVIDPASNTLYVVSASEAGGGTSGGCSSYSGTFYHRLHAIDLFTGIEKFNAPVTIAASVPGTGDGSVGGMVSFNSQLHHNRSGLVFANGTVYVAFAAHEDATPYHGWIIAYDASNVQSQTAVFNTTPNGIAGVNGGADGGIWGGGGAPALDAAGDLFISTGNGIYDESSVPPSSDYGDSVLRLHPISGIFPNGTNLTVAGWFTPNDQLALAQTDTDLGSGAPILLPDQTTGPVHLLVEIGKEGVAYLLDRDNMGQFNSSNNQIVQSFSAGGGLWGTPAYWNNNLYYAGAGDFLKAFALDSSTGLFNPAPASQSSNVFNFPDAIPSISALGLANGIAWAVDAGLYGYASPNAAGGINCSIAPPPTACTGPAILHAYDATNLATELWNSSQAANKRDQAGNAVKFVPPTVANGKVYLGTRTEVDVYGLLPN